ncbi:chemotaxis protein [Bradyrhizobium sp. SYSU BS000235]|uniref:chemotaxis protein n=1 Tax=Bradyrhizobium sp. SYSU BS000235 TaxID=3411332 RepID=UPI003C76D29D
MSMSSCASTDIINVVTSVEDVVSQIETTFAQVGNHLGRGHAIFQDLNGGLALLSDELSGAKIEGATTALHDIAAKLTGLADVLPQESALLGAIGASANEASNVLKPLVKQIQMVMIIARSARIEAAALDTSQESFLDFTQEAFELAKAVQVSIDACSDDQQRLVDAINVALNRQREFEGRYRAQLLSVSDELTSAHSGMQNRQADSVRLAELTSASTKRIAEAVGVAIVSLQAGDSTRQRLEHVCRGLRIAAGSEPGLVPAGIDVQADERTARLICQLQVSQLKSSATSFDGDIRDIDRSLRALVADATEIVGNGRSLYGGDGDMTSFLSTMKQALAQASALISTCESSRHSVEDALSVVEETLGKFRSAITALAETIVDIILIGMNAGLKAAQLGVKGRAFVVIANELKATADNISAGADLLKPILDNIEGSAGSLKELRAEGDSSKMTDLEPSILRAIQEIEAGNGQLNQLMARLVQEGSQFEALMADAQTSLSVLSGKSATLPQTARQLEASHGSPIKLSAGEAPTVDHVFDDLYAQYTMVSERDVHQQFAQRVGLSSKPAVNEPVQEQNGVDDVLFF